MAERRLRSRTLSGGISKQPTELRYPNQVQDATNADFMVADGLNKRCGTTYIQHYTGLGDGANLRLHAIHRDDDEKYLVVYGDGVFEVLESDGTKATLTVATTAQTYLDLNDASADDLRLSTSADTTFIVNSTVQVDTSGTVLDYTVTETFGTYDEMASTLPSADALYFRTTEDDGGVLAGYWQYDVDGENGFAHWIGNTSVAMAAGWLNILGAWNDASNNPLGFAIRFQREALALTTVSYDYEDAADSDNPTLTKAGAFADYEFEEGDEIRIASGTGFTAGYYPIAARLSDNTIRLAATGSRDVNDAEISPPIPVADTANVATTGITKRFEFQDNFNTDPAVDLDEVALRIQTELRDDGANDVLVNWSTTRASFQIVSPWRGTGSIVLGIYAHSSGAVEQDHLDQPNDPFTFSSGTATAGSGSPTDRAPTAAERWVSVVAPGQPTATLDEATMPVELTRTTAPSGGAPAVFEITTIDWNDRLSGDQLTNPLPQPWVENKTIRDAMIFNGRLWMLSGPYILASQAGDIFNFFREDLDNVIDSDPIVKQLGGTGVSVGDFLVPRRESIYITTLGNQQFEFTFGDPPGPASALVTSTTAFNTVSVRPQAMLNHLYIPAVGKDGGMLREYFFGDGRIDDFGPDVSAHVEGLLDRDIRSIATDDTNGVAYVLTASQTSRLYVYRPYWNGSEKVQSAWTKYDLDSSSLIRDVAVLDGEAYLLIERVVSGSNVHTIEKFSCEADNDEAYVAPAPPATPHVTLGVDYSVSMAQNLGTGGSAITKLEHAENACQVVLDALRDGATDNLLAKVTLRAVRNSGAVLGDIVLNQGPTESYSTASGWLSSFNPANTAGNEAYENYIEKWSDKLMDTAVVEGDDSDNPQYLFMFVDEDPALTDMEQDDLRTDFLQRRVANGEVFDVDQIPVLVRCGGSDGFENEWDDLIETKSCSKESGWACLGGIVLDYIPSDFDGDFDDAATLVVNTSVLSDFVTNVVIP